ncbi:hypothetical protein CNY89_15605, partial [Amaricoccus sp. HAR-UPW-R2A-40]
MTDRAELDPARQTPRRRRPRGERDLARDHPRRSGRVPAPAPRRRAPPPPLPRPDPSRGGRPVVRLLVLLLLLPLTAQAESLTLTFVPHPLHDEIVAGEYVPVTLRAVYDRKVAREDLTIAPSDSFDWLQAAPDDWREEMIDGRRWIVMERKLALFPKHAGLLHFGPAAHKLTIIDENSRWVEREVVAHPLTLSVGAFPRERGWKLAAGAVTLTDELSADPSRLADGQTVTRRVTLRAKGVLPEALPPRPVVSEPWLISFAAPVERRLILTEDGPVAEAIWTWQFRPETGEPGVIPPVTIPFFNTETRRMDAVEIAALPIGYASFFTGQVRTGRFATADVLPILGALAAGLGAGLALLLRFRVPETTR